MFDSIRAAMREKEKQALSKTLQKKLRLSKNEISRRKDKIEHEAKKLENDIENLMNKASFFKEQGRNQEAARVVYEAREKDKAAGTLYRALEALSIYESSLSLMGTRLLSKEVVTKTIRKDGILTRDTQKMIERYAGIEEREDPRDETDIKHLERLLDSPMYSPATHNEEYMAARSELESIVPQTQTFQRYLGSFRTETKG